jgi:hypothetical protein
MGKFSRFLALAAVVAPSLLSSSLFAETPCESCPNFRLKDFEGCFISYGSSAGGVAGCCVSGVSETHLSQVKWDKFGCGTIGFLSNTTWDGQVAATFSNNMSSSAENPAVFPVPTNLASAPPPVVIAQATNFAVKLLLTDPSTGSGVIEITDFPFTGDKVATDFVAAKHNGQVVKYISSTVFGTVKNTDFTTNVPATGVSISVAERQG